MITKIRLILITGTILGTAALPAAASAATAPDAKRFYGIELQAKRFHGVGTAGYRGWGTHDPQAKRFHGLRPAGGRWG